MALPVLPPVRPMLAKSLPALPRPDAVPGGLAYEPKWDGFRCVVFRDGDEVELGSRNERPLTRYFPEVVDAVRAQLPPRTVVDGEIIIATESGLDFEALLQRIHPAASRVNRLAAETPGSFVAFDLLALGDEDLRPRPFRERRAALTKALRRAAPPVYVTPATEDFAVAEQWFSQFEGAGLDGVVAKPLDGTYRENERVMFKVKHARTADCVVAGFRWHKTGPVVGSLLLGLYDEAGGLRHVGVAASFTAQRRKELVEELTPYRTDDVTHHPWAEGFGLATSPVGRLPGAVSRWNAGKDLTFELLRPELVCEVAYDHMQGDRFRHATQFKRWRPERDPRTCAYDQLDTPVAFNLATVLAT
ncbi:MAG: ATP-dependent DNA ligase [Mycobacteriales bacterium]